MQIIRSIQNRIYEIRGEKVMLDFDLAALYEVETKIRNRIHKPFHNAVTDCDRITGKTKHRPYSLRLG